MNLVGQVLENRYKLYEPIGVGGMGTVYLAEHVLLGEECAVKVLSPRFAFDTDWIDRFLLEARAAIRIRHENIVQIKDFACPEPGLVYMVMEAISGENLADLLKRENAVSWQRALKMADHVAAALEAAHACGIIHRDIKPSNCMRTTVRGDADFIKVLDFGIAKFTGTTEEVAHAPQTASGVWMGTAEYMAPEMYGGAPPNARIDVYALGVLIYKLITGETPYQGTHLEVVVEQARRSPTPPGQRAPQRQIPAHVDTLVLRALARDPSARTPSMTALREEIAAALARPADVSLVVDVEEYEPTVVRRIDLLAHHVPTTPAPSTPAGPPATIADPPDTVSPPSTEPSPAPATSTGPHTAIPQAPARSTGPHTPIPRTPASSTGPHTPIPQAPATPTGPQVPIPQAPASSPAAASTPRASARSPSRPVTPPRSVATQTEPRRAVSAGHPPIPPTEVTPSRRRVERAPRVTAALAGVLALTVMIWRMTARPAPDTALDPTTIESADLPPKMTTPAPAPVEPPAPPPTEPLPASEPVALAPDVIEPLPTQPTADETIIVDESQPLARPASKPKPRPKKPVEPPRPLTVTKKDVESILDRAQSECRAWGVARGRRATLDIPIDSDGKATPRSVGMSDPFFVDCLNKKLKQAQFPPSQNGGTIRHEFVCC